MTITVKHLNVLAKDKRVRYIASGGFSFSFTLFLSWAFKNIALLSEELAVALSLVIAFFTNFFITRNFVFSSEGQIHGQLVRFALASITFRGLEYGLFMLLFAEIGFHYLFALAFSLSITFVSKYFFQKYFVFH